MPAPAPLTIRPSTRADVPLILSLVREIAEYERLAHEVIATAERVEQTLFGDRPEAEVILAHLADEPVGFAVFFPVYSTFLAQSGIYLEDLFVRPHVRSQGVGKALLARVAALAIERGYGRVEWSVLNWNEPAIRFYQSLGAKSRDGWTIYRLSGEEMRRLAGDKVE